MGAFERKSWEFEEMPGFLGGGKKGVIGGYRGLKKSRGEWFLERI